MDTTLISPPTPHDNIEDFEMQDDIDFDSEDFLNLIADYNEEATQSFARDTRKEGFTTRPPAISLKFFKMGFKMNGKPNQFDNDKLIERKEKIFDFFDKTDTSPAIKREEIIQEIYVLGNYMFISLFDDVYVKTVWRYLALANRYIILLLESGPFKMLKAYEFNLCRVRITGGAPNPDLQIVHDTVFGAMRMPKQDLLSVNLVPMKGKIGYTGEIVLHYKVVPKHLLFLALGGTFVFRANGWAKPIQWNIIKNPRAFRKACPICPPKITDKLETTWHNLPHLCPLPHAFPKKYMAIPLPLFLPAKFCFISDVSGARLGDVKFSELETGIFDDFSPLDGDLNTEAHKFGVFWKSDLYQSDLPESNAPMADGDDIDPALDEEARKRKRRTLISPP